MTEKPQLSVEDELVFASVSSNRNEKNISCCGQYLLFSRGRCPVIYDLESKKFLAQLFGHRGEVNGQCFIDNEDETLNEDQFIHIISTSHHDNAAIIWQVDTRKPFNLNSTIVCKILSPDETVFQTRCSLRAKDGFTSVMTTIQGNIYVFKNDQQVQSIETPNCYFDAKFFKTQFGPHSHVPADDNPIQLLSLAGSDNKVHTYECQSSSGLLSHLIDLSGFKDWIKCLDFMPLPQRDNEFLLAAACQDSLIQVWHLCLTSLHVDVATQARTNVSRPLHGSTASREVKLTATLETVLSGHEGFVHSISWFKASSMSPRVQLQLVSCSSDKTIIVWQSEVSSVPQRRDGDQSSGNYQHFQASEGIWRQMAQIGETGEANLPFMGVCLSKDEQTIFGLSLRGAIHSWTLKSSSSSRQDWRPQTSITGHFEAITDIVWDRSGRYILSSSLDKTTRLYAIAHEDGNWHELARPQVHGYEINCLAPLNFIKFASGAEEKTIRTFEATRFFLKNFTSIAQTQLPSDLIDGDVIHQSTLDELPAHAQLPALGLSNRGSHCPFDLATVDGDELSSGTQKEKLNTKSENGDENQAKTQQVPPTTDAIRLADNNAWHEVGDLAKQFSTIDHLGSPPFEEILIQSTLWWEKNKLFGHCNELFALASTSDGSFLASASKANRPDLASVIIWEAEKFRKVATLEHHTLTITRLKFSPDDKHLLSVSRDRTWCLFERNPNGQLRNAYRKLVGTVKSNAVHERIIWDCCWTPDSRHFCTVSRDKKAIIWSVNHLRSQLTSLEQAEIMKPSGEEIARALHASVISMQSFDRSIQAIDSSSALPSANQENCDSRSLSPSSSSPLCSSSSSSSQPLSASYLFALGFEDGSLELHLITTHEVSQGGLRAEWQLLKSFANFHQSTIKRLTFQPPTPSNQHWRPRDEGDQAENANLGEKAQSSPLTGVVCPPATLLLASGGDDCVLRLTRLRLLIEPK